MEDIEALKQVQYDLLDPQNDHKISYKHFEKWIGLDPDLLFSKFDLDKSGFVYLN